MQSALVTNRQFVIKYKIICLFTYLNNNKVWNKIMGNLLKALASRCDLKSVEILSKKREINEFSTWCIRSSGKYYLSFLHNGAFFVCDVIGFEYLLAHSAMLITSRSFRDPNARWRWLKFFNRLLTYRQIFFIS